MLPGLLEGVVSVARDSKRWRRRSALALWSGALSAGAGSFAWTRSRTVSEKWALIGGYVGGFAALTSLAIGILEKRLSDSDFGRLFRNANIGLVVGLVVVVVGFFPARHSEIATTALGLAMFVISMGVFFVLSVRDERARRKGNRRSP